MDHQVVFFSIALDLCLLVFQPLQDAQEGKAMIDDPVPGSTQNKSTAPPHSSCQLITASDDCRTPSRRALHNMNPWRQSPLAVSGFWRVSIEDPEAAIPLACGLCVSCGVNSKRHKVIIDGAPKEARDHFPGCRNCYLFYSGTDPPSIGELQAGQPTEGAFESSVRFDWRRAMPAHQC